MASRRLCSLRVIRWYEAPPLMAPARASSSGSPGSFQSDGCMPSVRSITIRSASISTVASWTQWPIGVVGVAVEARTRR